MLGDFRLHTTDLDEVIVKGKKNGALLACLLLDPDKRMNRSDAQALLWSQRSPDQAKASLRQCLSELRKQLEQFKNFQLQTNRVDISLQLDAVTIDTEALVEIADTDDFNAKYRFVDQCSGQFLKGLAINDPAFDDWLNSRRLHFADVYESMLKNLIASLDPGENGNEVRHLAHKLLESDICSEAGHMALMRSHFAEEGGKAKAIQQYRICCELLQKEVDAPPSQELRDLYEYIRTTEPGSNRVPGGGGREVMQAPRSYGLSVAVFPFGEIGLTGRSAGPGVNIATHVRNGLSRFSWLSVASRYATSDEAKQAGGYQKVSRDIDVRYVVDGYVDRSSSPGILFIELIDIIDDVKSTITWNEEFRVDFDDGDALRKTVASVILPSGRQVAAERDRTHFRDYQ